jgi:hypothetical protein
MSWSGGDYVTVTDEVRVVEYETLLPCDAAYSLVPDPDQVFVTETARILSHAMIYSPPPNLHL